MTDTVLTAGEEVARAGNNCYVRRRLATLRGRWLLDRGQPAAAITSLQSAIAQARNVGLEDRTAEAALALARLRQGEKEMQPDPVRWDRFGRTAAVYIARFWHEHGDHDRAVAAALRAFRDAHDPGEPYVYRWGADHARALLVALGEPVPEIPPYDPAADPPFPWEADVRALIDKLEAENAAKDAEKAAKAARESKPQD